MKIRNDSTLSTLTEEQQAQLYDWLLTLGYTDTLKKLAAPPPEGLGLKTHRATLHGFFTRYARSLRTRDLATADENRSHPQDTSILVADAEQSYIYAGHQIATGPMNSDEFAKVGRWLQSHHDAQVKREYLRLAEQNTAIAQRKAELAEKRHAFDREKYELNVAQLALQHVSHLQRIGSDHDASVQDRIRAARELLYGPPLQSASEPNLTDITSPEPPRSSQDAPALSVVLGSVIQPHPNPIQPLLHQTVCPKTAAADENLPQKSNATTTPLPPETPASTKTSLKFEQAAAPNQTVSPSSAPETIIEESDTAPSSSACHSAPPVVDPCSSVSAIVGTTEPSTSSDGPKNHAIKRWRAHLPRSYHDPEPDGSWRDECPCGKLHPCADHPDLWANVKGIKPQNSDYRACLEAAGIPFYEPTAKELGCSQEKLEQALNPFAFNPQNRHLDDSKLAPLYPPGSNPFVPLSSCA